MFTQKLTKRDPEKKKLLLRKTTYEILFVAQLSYSGTYLAFEEKYVVGVRGSGMLDVDSVWKGVKINDAQNIIQVILYSKYVMILPIYFEDCMTTDFEFS